MDGWVRTELDLTTHQMFFFSNGHFLILNQLRMAILNYPEREAHRIFLSFPAIFQYFHKITCSHSIFPINKSPTRVPIFPRTPFPIYRKAFFFFGNALTLVVGNRFASCSGNFSKLLVRNNWNLGCSRCC